MLALLALACLCRRAAAQRLDLTQRESLSDAWWTGPLLTPSAGTVPPGHLVVEPYFYDVVAPHANGLGSSTFVIAGVANRVVLGVIPSFGYTVPGDGSKSSGIGLGDITAHAQYRFTQFRPGRTLPTISAVLEETFPTGKYDRLGNRPGDGLGSGVITTTLALYSQTYFWMPTGRILRVRLNLSQSLSGRAQVTGVSVYGTATGFSGIARPGASFKASAASEYSLTRRWVLAADVALGYVASTVVVGSIATDSGAVASRLESGASTPIALAPAVEYNAGPRFGVIVGFRMVPSGRNITGTITPTVAVNIVR
ncbi:MAG: transporter [Gemmatimonadales bacterium]